MANCTFITEAARGTFCSRCQRPGLRGRRNIRECTGEDNPLAQADDAQADEPCRFLGAEVGSRAVKLCCGSERSVPLFQCTHPAHDQVTIEDCLACADRQPVGAVGRRLLLRFGQGFGDHVQVGVVLKHLRAVHPEWQIEAACRRAWSAGFVEAGLCDAVHERGVVDEDQFDVVTSLAFNDPQVSYAGCPSTKAERCLMDVFNIRPRPELCGYALGIRPEDREYIARWAGGKPYALLHYRGHSHAEKKNLEDDDLRPTLRLLAACGIRAVIHDFERQCRLGDLPGVELLRRNSLAWRTVPDAAALAALAEQAELLIGIDSGPGKVFGAVGTPALIVWRGHHPLHFHGITPNCLHLVPRDHERLILPPRSVGAAAFAEHYRHLTYRPQHLAETLAQTVQAQLATPLKKHVPASTAGESWSHRLYDCAGSGKTLGRSQEVVVRAIINRPKRRPRKAWTVEELGGTERVLDFVVPGGIGDISWVYSKLNAVRRLLPGYKVLLRTPCENPDRSDFVDYLPGMHWGGVLPGMTSWRVLSQSLPTSWPLAQGLGPLLPRGYPVNLAANLHLEQGRPLKDWLAHVFPETDYHYPLNIPREHEAAAAEVLGGLPRPIYAIYTSNRAKDQIRDGGWSLWPAVAWHDFLLQVHACWGGSFVFLGAEYDRDKTAAIASLVSATSEHVRTVIGQPLGVALTCLQRANYCFAYPSGIGILANVLRTPAVMLLPTLLRGLERAYADPEDMAAHRYRAWCDPQPAEVLHWFQHVSAPSVLAESGNEWPIR